MCSSSSISLALCRVICTSLQVLLTSSVKMHDTMHGHVARSCITTSPGCKRTSSPASGLLSLRHEQQSAGPLATARNFVELSPLCCIRTLYVNESCILCPIDLPRILKPSATQSTSSIHNGGEFYPQALQDAGAFVSQLRIPTSRCRELREAATRRSSLPVALRCLFHARCPRTEKLLLVRWRKLDSVSDVAS